jgi:hypothetical protein
MVATVLRDKYFRGGSFLQATLGNKPSFAWRSIMKARDVLDRGLIWRVGNGESIRLWGDKWLIGSPPFKVQFTVLDRDLTMRVCDLIDRDTGWWKVDVIRESFLSSDAEAICNLTINPLGTLDKLVWLGTASGCFLVRSAYHQEMAVRAQSRGESSNQKGINEV